MAASATTITPPLSQITPANVGGLKEAWRYPMPAGGLQAQPMMVGRTLYVVTTQRALAALDAASGQQKWLFDAKLPGLQPIRGLNSWRDGGKLRIVFGNQNFLYLIDAETGQPVPGFGDNGRIDVRANLRGPAENNAIYLTSPVSVYKDLLIVNGREAENSPASPGDVRASTPVPASWSGPSTPFRIPVSRASRPGRLMPI